MSRAIVFCTPGGGGGFDHGSAQSFVGSGFGTKSPAAPAKWNKMTGTIGSDYGLHVPDASADPANDMQYRSVGWQSVSGPHSRCTKYMVGNNRGTGGIYGGQNCMATFLKASRANNDIYFMSWYARVHPSWEFGPAGNENNHKTTAWNPGGIGPYEGDDDQIWYTDLQQDDWVDSGGNMGHKISVGVLQNPDNNGHNVFWDAGLNYASQWVHFEMEIKIHGSTGNTGYIKLWSDGTLVINYVGRTDNISFGPTASLGIGGYTGSSRSTTNTWRYFADHYLDWTPQRLVLANNATFASATIREPQIPTNWSDTQIDFTANLGKFQTPGATAWLFAFNASGAQVGSGQSRTVGT